MTHMTTTVTPAIGDAFGGGFFAGIYLEQGVPHALIVSPKAEGESRVELAWKTKATASKGARSLRDGLANSEAMNTKSHPAAHFCRGLTIGGFDDWYLPSRHEAALMAETLMPGAGYVPEQTAAEAFREGGTEAFRRLWYWTSTEFGSGSAWMQLFYNGTQYDRLKINSYWVRAVRKCLI